MFETGRHNVFVSYSHRDRAWLDRLQVHLRPLERAGKIDRWDDSRIRAGHRWREEIARALATADVAVLLLSADFLASDFIASEELPALLRAEQDRGLTILSVVVKPCSLADTGLAELQMVHPGSAPLAQMTEAEQEAVWVRVTEAIREGIGHRPPPEDTPDNASGGRPLWTLPYEPNPFFTGREAALTRLREQITAQGRAALTGLGGVGKTQLAVAYADRHGGEYEHILWTRASSVPTLQTGFADLARQLRLPEANETDQRRAVDATLRWLDSHQRWLLILDGADQPELAKDFRPRTRDGHLLVTSRNRSVQSLGIAQPLIVPEMTMIEAVAFLFGRTGRTQGDPREDAAAAELAAELGHLPLALEQAAAYITANQSRFQDYLRGYRSRRLAVLTAPVAGEYPDSVSTTWALNFRELAQNPAAADLLYASAFLQPDAIPLELIARSAADLGPNLAIALADVQRDPLVLDEALEPLYRYSLVRRDVGCRTYSILPIMQAVLLDGLSGEDQELWAGRIVRAVKRAFPTPYSENWAACGRLIPHAQKCAELIARFGFDFAEAGYLLLNAAIYLRRRARFAEAIALQEQLLSLRERTFGAEHTSVAETLVNLTKLYRLQGRFAEAEPLIRRALAIREQVHGSHHPEVARALNTQAALYHNLGRLEEAEAAARRALQIHRDDPGHSERDLAKALTNLGNILRLRGAYEDAEVMLRSSIQIEEAAAGVEHHDLASSLTMLADLCRLRGAYGEAERLLDRALALDEQTLGASHPNVTFSLIGLVDVLVPQNRLEEASDLYRRVLAIREAAFGIDHPTVLETRERYDALFQEGRAG